VGQKNVATVGAIKRRSWSDQAAKPRIAQPVEKFKNEPAPAGAEEGARKLRLLRPAGAVSFFDRLPRVPRHRLRRSPLHPWL